MSDTYVKTSREDAIGIITLDRPPANSYEMQLMTQFGEAVEAMAADDAVKVVLVVSDSEKFFCGGADIKAFMAHTTTENMDMIDVGHRNLARIATVPKMFIAVINGYAMGGGLEIALACDLRVAGDGKFVMGLPEVNLGILPGNGGTQRLSRLITPAKALEMMILGATVTPQQALELGLVNKVYPQDQLREEAMAFARQIASGATIAIGHIKRCVHEGLDSPLADGLKLERDLIGELFDTEDAKEGISAFAEKRKAEFTGK